jgi:hypothetical protein
VLDGGRVDDSAALDPPEKAQKLGLLLGVTRDVFHLELKVGPVDPGTEDLHVRAAKLALDIFDDVRRCGGGEREHMRVP